MDEPRIRDSMEVWDVRQDDPPSEDALDLVIEDIPCAVCGELLTDLADVEEGMHFLCDPTVIWQDEGGESGC